MNSDNETTQPETPNPTPPGNLPPGNTNVGNETTPPETPAPTQPGNTRAGDTGEGKETIPPEAPVPTQPGDIRAGDMGEVNETTPPDAPAPAQPGNIGAGDTGDGSETTPPDAPAPAQPGNIRAGDMGGGNETIQPDAPAPARPGDVGAGDMGDGKETIQTDAPTLARPGDVGAGDMGDGKETIPPEALAPDRPGDIGVEDMGEGKGTIQPDALALARPGDIGVGDMGDGKETIPPDAPALPETWTPESSPRPRRVGRLVVTPPPASAPSEFLDAQSPVANAPDAPLGPALSAPPPALPPASMLMPSPASAPAEFLDAQQPIVAEVKTPAELMRDFLEPSAAPDDPPPLEEIPKPASIRGLALARDERIIRTLQPDDGMTVAPAPSGPALILTNRRLIAFRGVKGYRDTHIAMLTGISQCSVHTGQRNWNAVAQGVLLMAAGALLYGVVGYWLAGQFSGPNIPALNMDLAPLIALLIILAGLLVLLQNYFTRPAGAIVFRGPGLELAFPYRSSLDLEQIYGFIYLAQSAARRADAAEQPPSP